METLRPFTLKVIAAIRKVPRGRVATYGQIAASAGSRHASRAVVWILHSSSKKHRLPWHRIVNARGKIAFAPDTLEFIKQRRLLESEHIEVDAVTGKVDLKRFQYAQKAK